MKKISTAGAKQIRNFSAQQLTNRFGSGRFDQAGIACGMNPALCCWNKGWAQLRKPCRRGSGQCRAVGSPWKRECIHPGSAGSIQRHCFRLLHTSIGAAANLSPWHQEFIRHDERGVSLTGLTFDFQRPIATVSRGATMFPDDRHLLLPELAPGHSACSTSSICSDLGSAIGEIETRGEHRT